MLDRKVHINLALQGGGSHGAFTWGVLDRLLLDETVEIGWVSGTSAGALNAVALAAGLAEGGRAGARDKLAKVWTAVGQANSSALMKLNPVLAGMSKSGTLAQLMQVFSPYDFNPLGIDPLRKLIEAHVDFARLRTQPGPELLIAATHVASGATRLFRRAELSVEAVLASACLPTLQHAVEIDGEAYWDGGFSANPDLTTLAGESPVEDTLIVQIVPPVRVQKPTSSREIAGHINHLMFSQPYVRELREIEIIRRLAGPRPGLLGRFAQAPDERDARIAAHRFHLIDAGRFTGSLSVESRGKPESELISYLHSAGASEAGKWLDRCREAIGQRDTADIAERLASLGKPQNKAAQE